MKAKRLLSVVLALMVVLSCVAGMSFVSAEETSYNTYAQFEESIKPENNYYQCGGYQTKGGAKEVGISTTQAAIKSTIYLLIADFIINFVFYL